jgi:membrane-associated protein
VQQIIHFFLHLDTYIQGWINSYAAWTYLILFSIIFCETGFVVTPFLPGDSILFMAGYFANSHNITGANHGLNLWILIAVMSAAAILGDTVNYWIGAKIGPRAFKKEDARILKKKYLDETHDFYEKYGKATIILARFVPIVRTFAPFVAGIGDMTYTTFLAYNIIGGIAWVSLFLVAGYFFGGISVVKHNFTLVIVAIVIISVLPMAIKAWSGRKKKRAEAATAATEEAGPHA